MLEEWKPIRDFPLYEVSTLGRIRREDTQRVLQSKVNQYKVVGVGLMRDGVQHHRSVPLLVATAFIPRPFGPFDTPINLDGDRHNNRVDNLAWRPRWFAIAYNRQFRNPYRNSIEEPIQDMETGETYRNSFEAATANGLLEKDLVLAILNRTYVWPTYQQFGTVGLL